MRPRAAARWSGRSRWRAHDLRTRAGASSDAETLRGARLPSPPARARRSRHAGAAARPPCAAPECSTSRPQTREYNQRRLIGVVGPVPRPATVAPPRQAAITPGQTDGPRAFSRGVRASLGAGVRPLPRLLPDPLALRAGLLSGRLGRRTRDGDVHARLLSSRARPLRRGDDDEAIAGHAEESQAALGARAISGD